MSKIFLNNIQDLIEIQKVSFYKFLINDIKQIFFYIENPVIFKGFDKKIDVVKFNKASLKYIQNIKTSEFLIFTDTTNINIKYSKINKEETFKEVSSYYLSIRILLTYYKKFSKKFISFKKHLIKIPLLTSDGNFIINGCERIIVNQTIKRPGVYFNYEIGKRKQKIYKATIVSSTHFWTRIYLDEFIKVLYDPTEYEIDPKLKKIPLTKRPKNRSLLTGMRDNVSYIGFNSQAQHLPFIKKIEEAFYPQKPTKFYTFKILHRKLKNSKYLLLLDSLQKRKKESVSEEKKELNIKLHSSPNILYIFEILSLYKISLIRYFDLNPNIKFDLNVENYLYIYEKNPNLLLKIFNNLYFDSNNLAVGHLGRRFMNQKFSTNVPQTCLKLCFIDIINIINELYLIKYDNSKINNLDHVSHKQIRSIGEILSKLLSNSIKIFNLSVKSSSLENNFFSFKEYSNILKQNIDNSPKSYQPTKEIIENFSDIGIYNIHKYYKNLNIINTTVKDFFTTSQISQFADQINSLSTLTHKRRISVFGPQGLARDQISSKLRDIHPSQYGKICPIETPEGRNAGIVTTLALFSRKDFYEFLETPYLFLNQSQIFYKKGPIFLNGLLDDNISLSSLNFSSYQKKIKVITSDSILSKHRNKFYNINTELLQLLTLSPTQILSLGTSIIPFVEHNDGNRALMGANMLRQAIPCLIAQNSIVGIQTDFNIALDSGYTLCSYSEGKIFSTSAQDIRILDIYGQYIYYTLPQILDTNQLIYLKYKPTIWPNEKIYSGEVIAVGESVCNGEAAFGQNLTVAYMPWEGYNFEDAIIINEKLITNNILTSIHIEQYDIFHKKFLKLNEIKKKLYELNFKGPSKRVHEFKKFLQIALHNYDENGIILPGNYIYPDTPLILQFKSAKTKKTNFLNKLLNEDNSFFEKLERISDEGEELTTISNSFDLDNLINSSIKAPIGLKGRLVGIKFFDKKDEFGLFQGKIIHFYIANYSSIEVGDKLSGRHGNKGVISRILSNSDMPLLSDGSTLDLVLNPLGVPSRMNVGQVFECLLGITGEKLGLRYKVLPFDEIYGKNISQILVNTFLSKVAYKLKRPWFYPKYSPGKMFVRDGRTGEYFDNSVLIGKAYILKLIHLVQDKIHARALGPYAAITEQPLGGRAKEGGQRFGEMEAWALEAHGCSLSLQEILTIKSDNLNARNNIFSYILNNKDFLPIPNIPEAFLLLVNELRGLGLNIQFGKNEIMSNVSIFSNYSYKKINIFKYIESELKMIKNLDYGYFRE